MSRTRGTFSPFGNASPRPDFGNRYYVRGGGGGNNPRGTRGGPFTRSTSGYFPPEADIKEGLDTSRIIETIPSPARLSAPEHIPIENTRYVASYNWVAKEEPTIVVPGTGLSAPLDIAPTLRRNARRFTGFVDWPRHPVHPSARRRLQLCRPEYGPYVAISAASALRRRRCDT